jgi:hypothetical protein
MKRRLVLQPELGELIASLSRHRPESEKLGRRLSEAEYLGMKAALGREDVQLVTRFVPGDGEGPVPADTRRRLLVEQRQMVKDKNRAMLRLLEGIELAQAARGGSPRLWQHFPWSGASCCTTWERTIRTTGSSAIPTGLLWSASCS